MEARKQIMAKTKSANDKSGYVKKETMLFVAFLTLAAGFIGGVVFGVYKSSQMTPLAPQASGMGGAAPAAISKETAQRIAALEQGAAKNPGDPSMWAQLGHQYFDTNQFAKAIEAYKKSLAIEPHDANVWTDMGVMYRRNGDPKEAVKSFDEAIKVNPRHEISRFNKGIVLLHDLNDRGGAIQAWEALVMINPDVKAPSGKPVRELIEQFKAQSESEKDNK